MVVLRGIQTLTCVSDSPAEYGSCLSTFMNSSLSYLARIHCSRRSLRKSRRWR